MITIIGRLASDPTQVVIAIDPPANTDTPREKPCEGCGHGTLNTIRVGDHEEPCCGDPWCTRIVRGDRRDRLMLTADHGRLSLFYL